MERLKKWLESESLPNIFEILTTSINTMETKISRSRMKIDLLGLIIRPGLWDARFLAFNQADKIIVANFG
jgi:NTE family protein